MSGQYNLRYSKRYPLQSKPPKEVSKTKRSRVTIPNPDLIDFSSVVIKDDDDENRMNHSDNIQIEIVDDVDDNRDNLVKPSTPITTPLIDPERMLKRIISVFKKTFPRPVYHMKFKRSDGSFNDKDAISIYYKEKIRTKSENSRCLYIELDLDDKVLNLEYLKFEHPNICKINGAELLFLLYKVAREIKFNINIEFDKSKKLYGDCEIMNLASYEILRSGKTYYNRFGYGESNKNIFYYESLENNESVRNMKLYDLLAVNNKLEFLSEFESDIDRLNHYASEGEGKLSMNSSLKEVIIVIDKLLRKYDGRSPSEDDKKILCSITKFVNIIIALSYEKLEYLDASLVLDIDDPDTIRLYEELEKKIKITTSGGEKRNGDKRNGNKTRRRKNVNKKTNTRRRSKRIYNTL